MDERKTTNKSDVGTGEILEEKARWCIREALVGVSEMSMLFASTPAAMVPGDDTEHMRDQRGKKKSGGQVPSNLLVEGFLSRDPCDPGQGRAGSAAIMCPATLAATCARRVRK